MERSLVSLDYLVEDFLREDLTLLALGLGLTGAMASRSSRPGTATSILGYYIRSPLRLGNYDTLPANV